MVDRSVEVVLRARVSDFKREISDAAVTTDRLDASLAAADASSNRLGSTSRKTAKDVDGIGDSAKRSGAEIDKLSGRLKLYMQLAATAGPGLIPIAATAAPGLGAVIALLASGAAGALAMVVALQGVADATKAIDAYQLDPTVENLQAARESLEALPPSAAAFVMAFQDFQPTLTGLQRVSANGAMPGLIETLENAKTLAPQVADFLGQVSRAAGDAAADSSASLASDRWRDVFDYFTGEAPGKLTALTGIVGDLGHGFGELLMSLDPGSDSATAWVSDVADAFDRWASSEKGREDVRALTEYLRENGPAVEDFFVGGANAVTQFVQAAAPLGGATLTILSKLLDGFAGIADSDIGTPLLAGAAALSVYNRALAVTARLQNSPLGQKTGMFGGLAADAVAGQKSLSLVDKLKSRTPAVRDFGNALLYAAHSNEVLTKAQGSGSKVAAASATNALRAREAVSGWARDAAKAAAPIAKTGAAVAGLAVVSTGAADKIGLTNTASLTLMGTMAGPYGAAIGAATGMVLDIAAANDGWVASQEAVNATYEMSTDAFVTRAAKLRDMREEMAAQNVAEAKFANDIGSKGYTLDFKSSARMISGAFGDNGEDAQRKYLAAAAAAREADEAVAGLAASMGRSVGPIDGSARSAAELDAVLTAAQPAMDALGISQQQLITAYGNATGPIGGMADALSRLTGGEASSTFDILTDGISRYIAETESMAGRTRGVGEAIAGLDDELLSTADSASQLATALDALLGPNLNLSQATDDWTRSLRTLNDDLAEHSRTLEGNTTGALTNRDAIRKRVGELSNMISMEAEAGAGPAKLSRTLTRQRAALLDSAEAAGLNRKQVSRLLNQMGLTPKLVRTVFKAAEADRVEQQVKSLRKTYDSLPPRVQAHIKANGIPETKSEVNSLVKAYNLTPREKATLMRMVDQATGKTKAVQQLLRTVGAMKPAPVVNVNDQATGRAQGIKAVIDSITGKTVYITTVHRDVRVASSAGISANPTHNAIGGFHVGGVRQFAAGGYGLNGRYYSREPQMVAGGANILWGEKSTGWEAYISGDPAERDRNLDILGMAADRLGATVEEYAAGGLRKGRGDGGGQGNGGRGGQGGRGGRGGVDAETRAVMAEVRDILRKAAKGADTFAERVKKSAEALKVETKQRADLVKKSQDYQAEVAGAYRHDLFGNGLAGLQLQLDADKNDALSAWGYLNKAKSKGLDGALFQALAASGDVNTAQQISMLDRRGIAGLEAQYAGSMKATAGVGGLAADAKFGKQLDHTARVLTRLDRTVGDLQKQLGHVGKNVRDGAKAGSREGTQKGSSDRSRGASQRSRTGGGRR